MWLCFPSVGLYCNPAERKPQRRVSVYDPVALPDPCPAGGPDSTVLLWARLTQGLSLDSGQCLPLPLLPGCSRWLGQHVIVWVSIAAHWLPPLAQVSAQCRESLSCLLWVRVTAAGIWLQAIFMCTCYRNYGMKLEMPWMILTSTGRKPENAMRARRDSNDVRSKDSDWQYLSLLEIRYLYYSLWVVSSWALISRCPYYTDI
jgi:hypothetical protein